MELYYEFGGSEEEQGEEFKYTVADYIAFDRVLKDIFGYEQSQEVEKYLGDYIDRDVFLDAYRDWVKDIYEYDAYRDWEESREVQYGR